MKRILVATDFSERSDRAIRRAVLLAKSSGAALTLAHVVDDDQPARLLRAAKEAAEALLDEQSQALRDVDGLACDHLLFTGDPFDKLVAAVKDRDPDLLVIGPHRRRLLRDVFVGTTAERTIRASNKPVLMANGVPGGPYRHILIAVDLSECSADAVRAVQGLGLARRAKISVLHIYEAPHTGHMVRASLTKDEIKGYMKDEEKRADAVLSTFLRSLDLEPDNRLLELALTSTADCIHAAASEVAADLVVVGTRGHGGMTKFLLGSVAEGVLRIVADRDVLAVPPRGE